MITTFIFDMGNVLLDYNPGEIMKQLVRDPEKFPAVMAATLASSQWALLDQGILTQEEALAQMIQQAPRYQREIEEVMARWDETLAPIPGMLELVAQLKKKGYGLHLLSNASLRFYQYAERYPVMALFDSLNISASMKLIKPDPKIYQHVLRERNLIADACLFVDDREDNIQGAQSCGLHTFQFTSPERFHEFLCSSGFLEQKAPLSEAEIS